MDEPPAALWTIGAVARMPRRIPHVKGHPLAGDVGYLALGQPDDL